MHIRVIIIDGSGLVYDYGIPDDPENLSRFVSEDEKIPFILCKYKNINGFVEMSVKAKYVSDEKRAKLRATVLAGREPIFDIPVDMLSYIKPVFG